jgi:hypothetical protein
VLICGRKNDILVASTSRGVSSVEEETKINLLTMKIALLQAEITILQDKLKEQAVSVLKVKKEKPTVILYQDNMYILDLQNRKLLDKFRTKQQQEKDKVS